MKSKKVSIIIRTKNEERWIGRCLESIFKQNYKNFLKNNRSFEESLISTSIIESVNKSLKTKKTQKI